MRLLCINIELESELSRRRQQMSSVMCRIQNRIIFVFSLKAKNKKRYVFRFMYVQCVYFNVVILRTIKGKRTSKAKRTKPCIITGYSIA